MKNLNQKIYQNLELILFYKKELLNKKYYLFPFSRSRFDLFPPTMQYIDYLEPIINWGIHIIVTLFNHKYYKKEIVPTHRYGVYEKYTYNPSRMNIPFLM